MLYCHNLIYTDNTLTAYNKLNITQSKYLERANFMLINLLPYG